MNVRALSESEVMDRQIAQLRVPPHSIEAESSVLGGLLLDNGTWDRVGDLLADGDFYSHAHRQIYAAMAGLINASRQADVITVFEHLQSQGKAEETGGLAYLNALAQYVPSAGNIRRYAEIVRERAILRKLVSASDEIAASAFNPDGRSVAQILDAAQGAVVGIGEQARAGSVDDWEDAAAGTARLLDHMDAVARGEVAQDFTPTGLADLDARLDGGPRPSQLIVIGARPGMGKSALSTTIGLNIAKCRGLPVGMFSMEMSRDQQRARLLSSISGVHLSRIKRPELLSQTDWSRITAAAEVLRGIPFVINDQGGLNINQLRAYARRLYRKHGQLGALIVDYLQLMAGTDSKVNRTYQLEEATRGLKALAKELQVPILLLAQVNRGVEKELDPMPRLSDLKDCGAIEQDADIVLFIHRPIKVKPELMREWKSYAQVRIAKHRDGETGDIHLRYLGENTLFTDWLAGESIPSSKAVTRRGGDL